MYVPRGLVALCLVVLAVASRAESFANESVCVTEPRRDATLSFTVPGRIDAIHFQEGKQVAEGAVLVNLGQTVEGLEVRRRFLIWQDKSDLTAAKQQNDTFKVMLDSTRGLFEATGSVSRDDLFKMELEFNSAQAEYQRLLIAEEREDLEHQLAVANLQKRQLVAPFAGTIVEVLLEEGEICEANQPLIKLVDTSGGYLVCNIEERTARLLEPGDELPIGISLVDERWESTARVEFVAPVVDPASGLLRVKLSFHNPNGRVRPGVPGYVMLEGAGPLAGARGAAPGS